jgi:hypothetical protein
MESRINDNIESIDQRTSRSIREAVAERLRENLRSEPLRLSSQLTNLVERLRRSEGDNGPISL